MEPEVSLQQPTTGAYPEPAHLTLFPPIHFSIFPSTPSSSTWSLPFRFSNQNIIYVSRLSHACYMSHDLILLDFIILIMSKKE
jgi:hypothetical protein